MVQKQDQTTALPGVWATLSAGFELTTRYLWLMVIPAALDFFLWIGPRLSFRTLLEGLITTSVAQLPADVLTIDTAPLLEAAGRLNHFAYLSVSLLGVPALMTGPTPDKTPITPAVIAGGGLGQWLGLLVLFTVAGLLLTALFYSLIAYALRRSLNTPLPPLGLGRFLARTTLTWLRLLGLLILVIVLVVVVTFPMALLAGFLTLFSQTFGVVVMFAAIVLVMWLLMFLSYTPQGMLLNPHPFFAVLLDSVRLFRQNFPSALGLLAVVVVARQLLSAILLRADSGTWVTAINILAHAYIATALTVAMVIFYRDRFIAHLRATPPPTGNQPVNS